MDITFKTTNGYFNYRTAAIILHNNQLLVMKDERSPYFYLPGGRVALFETAEQAVLRELFEELNIEAEIIRPLWLNQSFFTEDVNQERYHELCLYFLIDISKTDLLSRGNEFISTENGKHHLVFTWLPIQDINNAYLYPLFLKDKITQIPNELELITEQA